MSHANSKVLIVLEAGDAYPSGYLRGLIYRDHFAQAGFQVEYVSRLHPRLVRIVGFPSSWLIARLRPVLQQLTFALGRVSERLIVRKARGYDVVYMSKVTTLRFVKELRRTNARLVLDFGDAVWLPGRAGEQFNEILQMVDAITTDNEVTADYARKLNPNCMVIPDCPQIELFDRRRSQCNPLTDSRITLGWIGSPGTAYNLFVVWEALEKLFGKYPNLHLRLLGMGTDRRLLPPFERVKYSGRVSYSQAEMIDEVLAMNIGLFPLQDVEASHVRGALKATVYMAGEAVAVCSPVGQCADLIQDGVNGMLARDSKEWFEKIEQLILAPDLRQRISEAGLKTVRGQFTVAKSFERLRSVLDNVNGKVETR